MSGFALDPRLRADCFELGRLGFCRLLLLDNAAVPWFILVPETDVCEIIDLAEEQQLELLRLAGLVARFVRTEFPVDKLNIAAIGNVVRQLHVHVVGRSAGDYCWPGVVWGTAPPARYTGTQVDDIRALAARCLAGLTA